MVHFITATVNWIVFLNKANVCITETLKTIAKKLYF